MPVLYSACGTLIAIAFCALLFWLYAGKRLAYLNTAV
jgi:hypothetical protein